MAESSIYFHSDAQENAPQFLYKIVTTEAWQKSQGSQFLKLSDEDSLFIHLSREDQLDRIIGKYWSHQPHFIVLKVKTDLLPGRLVFEVNPGGTTKYYHLYNGSIPMKAIEEIKKKDKGH